MYNMSEQFHYNVYITIIAFIILIATMIAFRKKTNISKKIINFISFYFIVLIGFNTFMSLYYQNIFYVKICILLSLSFLVIKLINLLFNNYFFYFHLKSIIIKNNLKKIIMKKQIKSIDVSYNKNNNKLICNIYLYIDYEQEKDYEIITFIKDNKKLSDDVNIFYL